MLGAREARRFGGSFCNQRRHLRDVPVACMLKSPDDSIEASARIGLVGMPVGRGVDSLQGAEADAVDR